MGGEVAHLSWSEACEESIESVVDNLEIIDVRRHLALYLEGVVVGETRSYFDFQLMELKFEVGKGG